MSSTQMLVERSILVEADARGRVPGVHGRRRRLVAGEDSLGRPGAGRRGRARAEARRPLLRAARRRHRARVGPGHRMGAAAALRLLVVREPRPRDGAADRGDVRRRGRRHARHASSRPAGRCSATGPRRCGRATTARAAGISSSAASPTRPNAPAEQPLAASLCGRVLGSDPFSRPQRTVLSLAVRQREEQNAVNKPHPAAAVVPKGHVSGSDP